MREYEITMIIQPEISDEAVQELCGRLDGIVEGEDGVRLMYDDQGRRRLAYEIQNFQKGRYLMLHFLGEGRIVPVLERALRLEDSVLRFLTVQVSDEVADVEGRKAEAAEEVRIREQKAAERAAREAEQAAERAAREAEEAVERAAREAEQAAAAAAAAEKPDEGETGADADEAGAELEAAGAAAVADADADANTDDAEAQR